MSKKRDRQTSGYNTDYQRNARLKRQPQEDSFSSQDDLKQPITVTVADKADTKLTSPEDLVNWVASIRNRYCPITSYNPHVRSISSFIHVTANIQEKPNQSTLLDNKYKEDCLTTHLVQERDNPTFRQIKQILLVCHSNKHDGFVLANTQTLILKPIESGLSEIQEDSSVLTNVPQKSAFNIDLFPGSVVYITFEALCVLTLKHVQDNLRLPSQKSKSSECKTNILHLEQVLNYVSTLIQGKWGFY